MEPREPDRIRGISAGEDMSDLLSHTDDEEADIIPTPPLPRSNAIITLH